jgi:hypothetical protein
VSAVARRRAEFDASLAKFAASCPAVVASVRRAPPVLLVGGALAGGAVHGRVVGFNRLLAPSTLLAGALEEQFVKVLFGAGRRLWDAHRRDPTPEETVPEHEGVADPPPRA